VAAVGPKSDMSHEPYGNRWAGAPQTARGRKLQEHVLVMRQLRREAGEPEQAGPPAAAELTHTELLRSRNAACMRVASITSSSDDPLERPVRLRRSAEPSQRPPAAAAPEAGVGDKGDAQPDLSEPPAHDARSHTQSTQRPDPSRGDENVPPPRRKAKHPGEARGKPAELMTRAELAAVRHTRAELVEARRMLYATQEVGVAQPEQFSGCLTDCAPLSRLLLRGLPARSAQRRYEERRIGPGAFDAYPPLPQYFPL